MSDTIRHGRPASKGAVTATANPGKLGGKKESYQKHEVEYSRARAEGGQLDGRDLSDCGCIHQTTYLHDGTTISMRHVNYLI